MQSANPQVQPSAVGSTPPDRAAVTNNRVTTNRRSIPTKGLDDEKVWVDRQSQNAWKQPVPRPTTIQNIVIVSIMSHHY